MVFVVFILLKKYTRKLKLTNKFHENVHPRNALEHSDTDTTYVIFASFTDIKFANPKPSYSNVSAFNREALCLVCRFRVIQTVRRRFLSWGFANSQHVFCVQF